MLVRTIRLCCVIAALCLTLLAATSAVATPTFDPKSNPAANWSVSPRYLKSRKPTQVVRAVAVQPDGRVVVPMALSTSYGHLHRRPVLRYNVDGSRDYSWGYKGVAQVRLPKKRHLTMFGAASAADGSIFIWGYSFKQLGVWRSVFVVKLTPDGRQDMSFAGDGAWESEPDTADFYSSDRPSAWLFPTAQGGVQFVTAVYDEDAEASSDALVVTLRADGVADASTGFAGTRVLHGPRSSSLTGVAESGDHLHLLFSSEFGGDCMVRRVTKTGSGGFASDYGTTGRALIPLPAGSNASDSGYCRSIAGTPDGGVVVSGGEQNSEFGGAPAGYLAKLGPTGFADSTFGTDGAVKLAGSSVVVAVASFSDGSLIASGFSTGSGSQGRMFAFSPTGAPISSFGTNGDLAIGRNRAATVLAVRGDSAIAAFDKYRGSVPSTSNLFRVTN